MHDLFHLPENDWRYKASIFGTDQILDDHNSFFLDCLRLAVKDFCYINYLFFKKFGINWLDVWQLVQNNHFDIVVSDV